MAIERRSVDRAHLVANAIDDDHPSAAFHVPDNESHSTDNRSSGHRWRRHSGTGEHNARRIVRRRRVSSRQRRLHLILLLRLRRTEEAVVRRRLALERESAFVRLAESRQVQADSHQAADNHSGHDDHQTHNNNQKANYARRRNNSKNNNHSQAIDDVNDNSSANNHTQADYNVVDNRSPEAVGHVMR